MPAIKPLNDRILVKRSDPEAKTSGGIIIPDNAKEKPVEAVVIAVGPGGRDNSGRRIEPNVKPGDRVLLSKYSGSEVKLEGADHAIVREDDILAVLD